MLSLPIVRHLHSLAALKRRDFRSFKSFEIVQDKSVGASCIYNNYAFFARNRKFLNFNSAFSIESYANVINARVK